MKYDPNQHRRRSLRLMGYDYSQPGAYFVKVCTQGRQCLFGRVVTHKMQPNDAGRMVQACWQELPNRFPFVKLDQFVVMPNYFHGIIQLIRNRCRGEPCVRPDVHPHGTLDGTIGRIIQAFKSVTAHGYIIGVRQHGWTSFPGRLWQRNYYEKIIRDDETLNVIRQYIMDNPAQWEMDSENLRTLYDSS